MKQQSERRKRFHFNNSDEVKQPSQRSQRFHFNSSEVKQGSGRSERFHFNSSEGNRVVSVVRDVIVIVMNLNNVVTAARDFMLIGVK